MFSRTRIPRGVLQERELETESKGNARREENLNIAVNAATRHRQFMPSKSNGFVAQHRKFLPGKQKSVDRDRKEDF
jgi:hypothetical protein